MPPHVALVGNPNVGKTTLFNELTGLAHTTGNYPGVTVDRKFGTMKLNGSEAVLVDLPGTYSLAAQSPDEMIVFDVLMNQQQGEDPIEAVITVVDATNLDRNLYVVSQIRDLELPTVVALNMIDLAKKQDIKIDVDALSDAIGLKVVPICARSGQGLEDLRSAVDEAIKNHKTIAQSEGVLPDVLRDGAHALADELNGNGKVLGRDVPWQEALRILVDRSGYAERRAIEAGGHDLAETINKQREVVAAETSLAALETRGRYAWIRQAVANNVHRPQERFVSTTDKIDHILTPRIWGSLVFIVIMGVVFQAIYAWAGPFMDMIDWIFGSLGEAVASTLPEGALQSLIVDGLIAGVGGVVIFLPQIIILSLFIAILEDCGYMARAAFLMDRLLSRVGLSGQSFIPLLSSFACAIPGVMATRTIPNTRDRLATMLVAPLMSCSARLPVYIIMIAAFVPERDLLGGLIGLQGFTLFAMYCVGVVVAIPVTWIIKKFIIGGETPPFLMELPTYKAPQFRTVYKKVSMQGWMFLRRAGTIIVAITVVVWGLSYFPRSDEIVEEYDVKRAEVQDTLSDEVEIEEAIAALDAQEEGDQLRQSFFGRIGHAVEPVFKPLGWDWRISVAAIASFPAREVVVAVMGTLFNLGSEADAESAEFGDALHAATWPDGSPVFNLPVALSLMVFFALCCQCGATLAVIKRETGTWRWPLFTFGYMTVLAYIAGVIVYQGTMALGWGA